MGIKVCPERNRHGEPPSFATLNQTCLKPTRPNRVTPSGTWYDSISSGSVRVSNGKITLTAETHLPNGGEVLPVSSPLPLVPPSIAPGLEPILYQQADTLRWYTFFLLDMQRAVFEAMALPSQGRPT